MWEVYLRGMEWGVFVIIKLSGDLVGGNGDHALNNLIGDGHSHSIEVV